VLQAHRYRYMGKARNNKGSPGPVPVRVKNPPGSSSDGIDHYDGCSDEPATMVTG
jgi:hypothetical protein